MTEKVNRIRKVSQFLKSVFGAITALIPVGVTAFWLCLNSLHQYVQFPPFVHGQYPLSPTTQWLGLAASTFSVACIMSITWQLTKLFSFYSQGIIFTQNNTRCLKRMAFSILMYAPISVVVKTLITLNLSSQTTPKFEVSVSTTELGYLLLGSIVMVISWIMEEARRLKSDCDLTI